MSFLAKLFLDNTERIVHNANILFSQGVDFIGQPCTFSQGGFISLKVDRTHEDLFFEWAVAPTMMKEGYIRFYKPDGMSKFVDLEFWDCYCVDYNEYFSHNTPETMSIDLVLSPGVLRFRDIVFEKHWKVTDLNRADGGNVITFLDLQEKDKGEPEFINMYIEDMEGNKISGFSIGDEINIVIVSKNAIGNKITVPLDNKRFDFKHKGKVLKNDKLPITINKDVHKETVKVIKQQ